MLNPLFAFLTFVFCFQTFKVEAQPTLAEFLHTSKKEHQTLMSLPPDQLPEIHYVMGNESADLDSIIAAMTYAYELNQDVTAEKAELYFPVLNIRREDLALRKDALYVFQQFGISPDDLLFLDDVCFDLLFEKHKLRLNLVDHNLLRPNQEHLSPAVERVIDHHVDENKNYPLLQDKVIVVVGSATTLVAEKILTNPRIKMTPEFAAVLLAPILIDTQHLESKEKTTDQDRRVVKSLMLIAAKVIPQDYYQKILAAKTDTSGLTPAMLLSKDFKEYLDGDLLYGISSIPASTSWWTEDEQWLLPVLEKFASDRQLAFLILLMANPDPDSPKRKIILYSFSPSLIDSLKRYLKEDANLKEVLIPGPDSQDKRMAYYTAQSPIARKQLQPLFHFSQRADLMSIFKTDNYK